MEHSTDVTIIGSGIIGANISFELNKKGYKTINVDKLLPLVMALQATPVHV